MPSAVPACAPQLAFRLGVNAPGAYDVNSGCSGFVYALNAASAAVRSGQARTVLVTASERFSGWIDFADRSTCIILGDGAGAVVVGGSEEVGIGPVVWGSDGGMSEKVIVNPMTGYFEQDGQAVYRWATTRMVPVALEACKRAGVTPSELAAFIPHQANMRIIDALVKQLKLPDHIAIARDIAETGNTSAASVPLATQRLLDSGEAPHGGLALQIAFGAGLVYAAQVIVLP
jgi:3-oxoacyl-[acyl-carrier-protein] synthase-3